MKMDKKHILFVCTANRYRSPIAEASLKRCLAELGLQNNWHVSSAGTWTKDGLPAMKEAVKEAALQGLDISSHSSRVIKKSILAEANLVLVMEQGQKEALQNEFPHYKNRVFLLSHAAVGLPYDIPDPVTKNDVGDVAKEICDLISENCEKIISLSL